MSTIVKCQYHFMNEHYYQYNYIVYYNPDRKTFAM